MLDLGDDDDDANGVFSNQRDGGSGSNGPAAGGRLGSDDERRLQQFQEQNMGSSERKKLRLKNYSIGPGETLSLGQPDDNKRGRLSRA